MDVTIISERHPCYVVQLEGLRILVNAPILFECLNFFCEEEGLEDDAVPPPHLLPPGLPLKFCVPPAEVVEEIGKVDMVLATSSSGLLGLPYVAERLETRNLRVFATHLSLQIASTALQSLLLDTAQHTAASTTLVDGAVGAVSLSPQRQQALNLYENKWVQPLAPFAGALYCSGGLLGGAVDPDVQAGDEDEEVGESGDEGAGLGRQLGINHKAETACTAGALRDAVSAYFLSPHFHGLERPAAAVGGLLPLYSHKPPPFQGLSYREEAKVAAPKGRHSEPPNAETAVGLGAFIFSPRASGTGMGDCYWVVQTPSGRRVLLFGKTAEESAQAGMAGGASKTSPEELKDAIERTRAARERDLGREDLGEGGAGSDGPGRGGGAVVVLPCTGLAPPGEGVTAVDISRDPLVAFDAAISFLQKGGSVLIPSSYTGETILQFVELAAVRLHAAFEENTSASDCPPIVLIGRQMRELIRTLQRAVEWTSAARASTVFGDGGPGAAAGSAGESFLWFGMLERARKLFISDSIAEFLETPVGKSSQLSEKGRQGTPALFFGTDVSLRIGAARDLFLLLREDRRNALLLVEQEGGGGDWEGDACRGPLAAFAGSHSDSVGGDTRQMDSVLDADGGGGMIGEGSGGIRCWRLWTFPLSRPFHFLSAFSGSPLSLVVSSESRESIARERGREKRTGRTASEKILENSDVFFADILSPVTVPLSPSLFSGCRNGGSVVRGRLSSRLAALLETEEVASSVHLRRDLTFLQGCLVSSKGRDLVCDAFAAVGLVSIETEGPLAESGEVVAVPCERLGDLHCRKTQKGDNGGDLHCRKTQKGDNGVEGGGGECMASEGEGPSGGMIRFPPSPFLSFCNVPPDQSHRLMSDLNELAETLREGGIPHACVQRSGASNEVSLEGVGTNVSEEGEVFEDADLFDDLLSRGGRETNRGGWDVFGQGGSSVFLPQSGTRLRIKEQADKGMSLLSLEVQLGGIDSGVCEATKVVQILLDHLHRFAP
uniref:Beta-Casp domain-containing protein n=1 Tax=Chromera velia CCMP2878 TaxID=1169474 RepID=A0A0G4HQK1_9ALVE|eukprot:Cvel_30236.t1-p1 / transcript=Cvel_30236.t1 / gene=Cvel_30236 / organism=Chromera_velia_CCMP2878 / gene_product=hypothetical protein / transcript_product=hypothetical protein / location=Cvel_scaffold4284:2444-6732(+) / protein_length=1004 / sequence_SO=supercontig / SO=protein_coding / is_pseudo=false